MQSLASELHVMLQHYIRAKVILGGLSFICCSAGMLVLGFPNALTLGILAGILEFIPVAGWMIAAATIISVGALTHSHWIWMVVLLCLWRILMDYLIAPRVMGHELEIHPLLALFTLMVGGQSRESWEFISCLAAGRHVACHLPQTHFPIGLCHHSVE